MYHLSCLAMSLFGENVGLLSNTNRNCCNAIVRQFIGVRPLCFPQYSAGIKFLRVSDSGKETEEEESVCYYGSIARFFHVSFTDAYENNTADDVFMYMPDHVLMQHCRNYT